MSNAISKIESAIKNGQYSEPVLRFRVYTLVNSERHLAAGSDWHLHFSANDRSIADEVAQEAGEGDLYFTVVIDGEAA